MSKENFFISTYILDNDSPHHISGALKDYPVLRVKSLRLAKNLTELQILKRIILNAKKNGDEAILVTKKSTFLEFYEPLEIIDFTIEVAKNEFGVFILDAEIVAPIISIVETLYFVENVKELNTFVLLKNTFNFFLNVIDSYSQSLNSKGIEEAINLFNLQKACSGHISKFIGSGTILLERAAAIKNQVRINLIVPFWNVSKYIEECCNSIIAQSHTNWRVFFVDDCSTDGSVELIPFHHNFFVKQNDVRVYTMQNIYDVIKDHEFESDDVIAILDGDDALLHRFSLDIINNIYSEPNITISYGSFCTSKNYSDLFDQVYSKQEFGNLRNEPWKASHLKSFRYKVYKNISEQDNQFAAFKDINGKFYTMTSDIALMFPLLEASGFERTFANRTPIYFYRIHENNDQFVNRQLQFQTEMEIRQKKSLKKADFF